MKLLHTKNQSRRGAALISSLLLVAAVASMGAGLVQISSVSTRRQNLSIDTTRALYIAEAALSEAYFAVAQGKSGKIGAEDEPAEFGDGYFWVEAVNLPGNMVELEATALHGRGKFTLGLTLNRSENRVATMGMCGLRDVTIGAGAILDSVGTSGYVQANTPAGAGLGAVSPDPISTLGVRSNGDITVYSNDPKAGPVTNIDGSVAAGPNGILDLDPSVVVTGTTTTAATGLSLPGFAVPKLDRNETDYGYPTGGGMVELTGDVSFGDVELPGGETMYLRGPLRLRAENLIVGADARLVIDTTGGPVAIYTTAATILAPGSILESLGDDPSQCSLFALATEETGRAVVNMGAKGEFFGMIVAPHATVNVPGNLHITGSIVAESLNIGSGAHLTYAEQLRDGGLGVKMTPTLVAWQILEVPDSPLTRGGKSVDEKIADLGFTTTPSSIASDETNLQLNYRDNLGAMQFYDGPMMAIPWGSVNSIDQVAWYDGLGVLEPNVRPGMVVDAVDQSIGNIDNVLPIGF